MLEAGVHFGHQTRFWNPKMAPFIFGERNKIHIINLEKTQPLYAEACHVHQEAWSPTAARCCSSAPSARRARPSQKEAERCGQPFVNQRWLGGMLTNFKTIRQSIKRLAEITELAASARWTSAARRRRPSCGARWTSSKGASAASSTWRRCPDALFVVDVGHENIAIHEAKKLGIPVVAIVDTNCSPDGIDYVIPGNDDAMRAIQLYAAGIADAVLEGKESVPQVAVGEDEFVELDEAGNPRRREPRAAASRARSHGAQQEGPAAPPAAAVKPAVSVGGRGRRTRRRWRRMTGRPSETAGAGRAAGTAWAIKRRTGRPRATARPRGGAAPAGLASAPRAAATAAPINGSITTVFMNITADAVKQLRERTGAGMMECKKALVETRGDLDAAAELMRKQGLAKADKKAARMAAEGVIVVERSADGHARPWWRSTARPTSSRASRTSAPLPGRCRAPALARTAR